MIPRTVCFLGRHIRAIDLVPSGGIRGESVYPKRKKLDGGRTRG